MGRPRSSSLERQDEPRRNKDYHDMEGVKNELRQRGRSSSPHPRNGSASELAGSAIPSTSCPASPCRSRAASSDPHYRARQGVDNMTPTDREVEMLFRENQALRRQLEHEIQRARAAEITAQNSRRQPSSAEATTGEMADHVRRLEAEVAKLRAELEESRSHVFSLQPYRREITPEEVASDWEMLFAGVCDCVERLVGPTLDSDTLRKGFLARARKHPTTWAGILKNMYQQPDLAHATSYPDTELDVLIAMVMRHLNERVFQATLYGALPGHVAAIAAVEGAMGVHVEPRRDQFAIRSWRAEALGALVADPNLYPPERHRAEAAMADELLAIFRVFLPHHSEPSSKERAEAACAMLREGCVQPAIRLHEKMLVSTHHFYTTLDHYYVSTPKREGGVLVTSPDLYLSLDRLDCRNVLQNRKTITRAKMADGGGGDASSSEQLHCTLRNVLALTPAVYMRQVGQRDTVKEPTLLCKQQMLVAWGSQEKREAFVREGEKTLLAYLVPAPSSSRQAGMLDMLTGGLSWGFGAPAHS